MENKPKLLVITAMDGKKVIGYKIEYEIDQNKYYSCFGGVDKNYRKHGFGFMLMKIQRQYLKENGYKIVLM